MSGGGQVEGVYEKSWRGRSDEGVREAMIVYKRRSSGLAWSTVMDRQHKVFEVWVCDDARLCTT